LALGSIVVLALAGEPGTAATVLHANGRIAFADVTGIASMNPDGSGQWGVELQVGDTAPAWSPDGSQLAVVTHWDGREGIMVMDPDGSNARMLTNDGGDRDPAWSPDGSRIAFANGGRIDVVNADGSGRRAVTTDAAWLAYRPSWSPDGSRIVFGEYPYSGQSRIVVLDLASGVEKALTDGKAYDASPAWSPDGNAIAFVSSRDGSMGVWAMSPDGTGAIRLSRSDMTADSPAWSPDGTQIAFDSNQQIWVMQRDGSGAHPLTSAGRSSRPAWQPLPPGPPGCTLWGTSGNDLLVGTDGRDTICGLDGNDTLIGLGGIDELDGGPGNDFLAGGLGIDTLAGDAGDDTIDARDGNLDFVSGGPGLDTALVDKRVERIDTVERTKIDPDLAVWRPATADAAEPTNPALRAVDGFADDWWNAGGPGPHWFEVDLGTPTTVARVVLIAPAVADGESVLLLGRSDTTAPLVRLHTFAGPTADQEQISFAPKKPWRHVQYLRLEVPGSPTDPNWVSWHELKVYSPVTKAKR
jgi:dipeptidyl aminopeptidase/acylaminoacyl peptidase